MIQYSKMTILILLLAGPALLPSCSGGGTSEDIADEATDTTTPSVVKTSSRKPNYKPPPDPGEFKITTATGYANTSTFAIEWTESPFVEKHDLYMAYDEGCYTPVITAVYQNLGADVRSQQVGDLPDGTYYVCLSSLSSRGNLLLPTNHPVKVEVDTVKPTDITLNEAGTIYSKTLTSTYTWTASSDGGSGLAGYSFNAGSTTGLGDLGTATIESGETYEFTGNHNTTYYIALKALDKAGNESAATEDTILYIDTASPETPAAITDPGAVASSTINFTWTEPTDDGFGIASYYLEVGTTPDASDMVSKNVGNVLTYEFTGGSHGITYYARVKAIDKAGNESAFSTSSDGVLLDNIVPSITTFTVANEAADGYINSADTASTNDFATFVGANYLAVAYSDILADGSGTLSCDGSQTYPNSTIPLINTTPAADDTYVLCVRLTKDLHVVYGKSTAAIRDTTPPVFTSVDLINEAADGYINVSENTMASDMVGNLVGSDITTSQYSLELNATTCDGAVTYDTLPQANSGSFAGDNTYKVCVEIIDIAGNPTYGSSSNIELDLTPAVFTSFTNANEVGDGYIMSAETTATNPVGTLTASGHTLVEYSNALVDSPLINCDANQTYGNATEPLVNSITADDTYAVCIKLTDIAGNITYGKGDQFIKDTIGPSFTSIDLINDAADIFVNLAETGNALDLVGNLVGVDHATATYSVEASGTTCDAALTYSASVPQGTSGDLGLDGSYQICVRLDDSLGNTPAFGASATFTLDKTVPSFTSFDLANESVDLVINVADNLLANDLGNNLVATGFDTASYSLVTDITTCDGALTYNPSVPTNDSADFGADDNYKVCVELSDNAGNPASYGSSGTFALDLTPPVFTSLDLINDAIDNYINIAENSNSNDMAGNLVATGQLTTGYALTLAINTCDNSLTYATIPRANDAGLVTQDDYKVCVELTDDVGNTTYGFTTNISFDNTTPTFTSIDLINDATDSLLDGSEGSNTTDIVGNFLGSGQDQIQYKLVTAVTTCDGALTYGATVPTSNDADMPSDDTYHVCVEVSDLAGNPIAYGSSASFVRDTLNPSFGSIDLINEAADTYLSSADAALTNDIVGNLVGTDYNTAEYALVGSATTCDGALTYGATIPTNDSGDFGADGDYKVCVKLSDGVSADAFGASATFTLDQAPPVFTSIDLVNEAASTYINLADSALANDLVGNLVASDYTQVQYKLTYDATTCDNALTYGPLPQNNSGDFDTQGLFKVCVELSDDSNNTTYGSSSSLTYDTIIPGMTSIDLVNDAADAFINLAESSSSALILGNDIFTGEDSATYAIAPSATTCDNLLVYGPSPQTNSGSFGGDGDYKVCILLTDLAGNPDLYTSSATFSLDKSPPVFTSIDLANEALDLYINDAEKALTSDLVTNLVASGHDTAEYKLVTDITTCDNALVYGASFPTNDSGDFGVDGDYKVCVQLTDNAGNSGAYGASATFTLDTTYPIFTSIDLVNDASDTYINLAETSLTNAVVGNLLASGHATDEYVLVASATTCDNALTYGAAPLGTDATFTTDGLYKVCLVITDVAGNPTYNESAAMTLDKSVPVFTSIDLANDTVDLLVLAAERVNTTAVATNLVVSDNDNVGYKLVLDATTCDGALTYDPTIPQSDSVDLSPDGSYYLCVEATDLAGNPPAYGNSASFVVNTIPTFLSVDLANDALDLYINTAENATSNDLVTNVQGYNFNNTEYKLVTSGTTCDNALVYSPTVAASDSADFGVDGVYKVCIAIDDGSNPADYGESATFTLDTTHPVFTSIDLINDAIDNYINLAETSSSVNLTGNLVASGHVGQTYELVTNATTCDNALTYSTNPFGNDATFTVDGDYKICIDLVDVAGNHTYASSATMTLDKTVPAFTSMDLTGDATDTYINIAERSNATDMATNLVGAGHDTVEYKLATNATTCDNALTYGASIPQSNSGDFGADGLYHVCVALSDNAGNPVSYGSTPAFTLDELAPAFTSIT